MLFGRKKEINSLSVMHYEGIPNFTQDLPCKMSVEDNVVIFTDHVGNVATLSCDRIQAIEAMPEKNFQAKYHNFNGTTKKTPVWFRVIRYVNSSGEASYITVWTVDMKADKFFSQIPVNNTPSETVL